MDIVIDNNVIENRVLKEIKVHLKGLFDSYYRILIKEINNNKLIVKL